MKKTFTVIMITAIVPWLMSAGSRSTSEPKFKRDYKKGEEYINAGDYDRAIKEFQNAIKRNPSFPEAHNMLAYSYRKAAKDLLQKSRESYEKALELRPTFPQAIEYQGELFVFLGELNSAYDNYVKLLNMGSDDADKLHRHLDRVMDEARELDARMR